MSSTITWLLSDDDGMRSIEPEIDGIALTSMIGAYETLHGLMPAGGYGGLVPAHYRFGDLRRYFAGTQQPWPGHRVPLLGCDCGEWGCWPLLATVRADDGIVWWHDFAQPHRPDRDYRQFGPFEFEAGAYHAAVDEAVAAVSE